ncbi:hypothetical protein [Winogradskya consettensis]|nr:hypothetical protein [Actinoplanes consettensis]
MPGRRVNLTDTEAHELVLLLMPAIRKLSASDSDPARLQRLRALLERLS